jgi:DNA-directed RNA polymerase specialized sigma24 family protein
MSPDEISEFFNWDKTKVRHLLYRGIDDIKEKMKTFKKSNTGDV